MNLSKECGNCKSWESHEEIEAVAPGICKRKKIFKSMFSQGCEDFKEYRPKSSTPAQSSERR